MVEVAMTETSRPASSDGAKRGPVLLVSGSFPPDVCGVGDYTERLAAAAPKSWELFLERDWSFSAAIGIFKRLLRRNPSAIILQYPTQGYRWSLIPHSLLIFGSLTGKYRTILALHEFSSLSHKARLALALTSRFLNHIVFTSEIERDNAHAYAFFSSRTPTSIVGILSNIPWKIGRPVKERAIDLAYFGHIRPNKGLEHFLEVMSLLREGDSIVKMAVIGTVPAGYEPFGEMVSARCGKIGCEMITGLSSEQVAETLGDTRMLYLPFPDGASARRGSILAGLGNGVIIATTVSTATPPSLLPALLRCTGDSMDSVILKEGLTLSNAEALRLQSAGWAYIESTLPRDWGEIASLYHATIQADRA